MCGALTSTFSLYNPTSDLDYVTFETHVCHVHYTFSPLAPLDAVGASHLFVMLMRIHVAVLMLAICTVGHTRSAK